jgi:hypothetical protein
MEHRNSERGQAIVLIVFSIFGLVVMAALIVDGGHAYLKRRNAQTAADAAAWAGAYERCINDGSESEIEAVIIQYAIDENGATAVDEWGITPENTVEVTVSVTTETFFAKVFGSPTNTVVAHAAAGCYAPAAADHVLPIAWSCRPPLPNMPSDSEECEYKAIPWTTMKEILADPSFTPTDPNGPVPILYHDDEYGSESKYDYMNGYGSMQLYVVMDSLSSSEDIPCYPNGTIDCDLDDDGRFDILGQGDRSWLILDGDSNNGQLDDIVRGDLQFGVSVDTWYPGRDGAVADVYHDAFDFVEGTPALIPVFESFCAPTSNPLEDPLCEDLVSSGDGLVQISTAASGTYYRVIAFAEFYVTCVSNKPGKKCPGKQMAVDAGLTDHNTPSIEGYFIDGWVADSPLVAVENNYIDLGVFVISLTE